MSRVAKLPLSFEIIVDKIGPTSIKYSLNPLEISLCVFKEIFQSKRNSSLFILYSLLPFNASHIPNTKGSHIGLNEI